jgi:hypothetical protein
LATFESNSGHDQAFVRGADDATRIGRSAQSRDDICLRDRPQSWSFTSRIATQIDFAILYIFRPAMHGQGAALLK